MAKLKEIRSRIASIKSTRQVTSAMKMVSAAKLKKAQDMLLSIAPFDSKLREIILHLSSLETDNDNPFLREPAIEKVLIIVVGTNRGLCGAFNANVVKKSLLNAYHNYTELLKNGKIDFYIIGRMVERDLVGKGARIVGEDNQLFTDLRYEEVMKISKKIAALFLDGSYQRIDIVYNKFRNAAVQEPTIEQFLPLVKQDPKEHQHSYNLDYIFEPSEAEIYESLIPQWLSMQFYRIMLDSNTAEQGARMTSMHQATDNATKMISELQVIYNNARQSAITNEIVEITAGAEALKG